MNFQAPYFYMLTECVYALGAHTGASTILVDLTLFSNRPLRVLHAIFTTRIILNVRMAAEKPVADFDKSCFGDIPTFEVHPSVGSFDHRIINIDPVDD